MPAIHQFVAGFANADAISNEARVLQQIFRGWGYASDIYSEPKRILPELRKHACNVHESGDHVAAEDLVLLHFSIGSPVNDKFLVLPCRKALLYHNITPPHYFDLINRQTAYTLARGREQLAHMAGAAETNMADSAFNAEELQTLGYADPKVLPLILDLDQLSNRRDRLVLRRFGEDDYTNIVFVGRYAPNKRIEDLIEAFRYYVAAVNERARLILVGSFAGTERYYALLRAQSRDLGDDRVVFAGSVPQAELNAFYAVADVFLCMSEHEGFCIPLLEAMVHDIPVLAFAAGAVPETMGQAGVVFREKRYPQVAEMIAALATPGAFRDAVIDAQRRHLDRYRARDLAGELRRHLAPVLPPLNGT